MSLKLYEIADEYRRLLSIMDSSDDDAWDGESFQMAIDSLTGDFTAKAANIGCMVRELTAESKAIKEIVDGLCERAQSIDKKAQRLRGYLEDQMQVAGLMVVSDARIKISVKKNPPSVSVESTDSIPVEYCRIIPERIEADKTAIKAALKSGIDIPGCSLVQSTRLIIQ